MYKDRLGDERGRGGEEDVAEEEHREGAAGCARDEERELDEASDKEAGEEGGDYGEEGGEREGKRAPNKVIGRVMHRPREQPEGYEEGADERHGDRRGVDEERSKAEEEDRAAVDDRECGNRQTAARRVGRCESGGAHVHRGEPVKKVVRQVL